MKFQQAVMLLATFIAVTMCCGCDQPTVSATGVAGQSSSPAGPVVRAVYLFNSQACQCERDRNEAADGVIEAVSANNPAARPPARVDVSQQPDELKRYQQMTSFGFMPVLLGLDEQNRVARKVEGFFKEPAVAEILLSQ